MNCEKSNLVLDWLGNELSDKEHEAFGAHLKDCADCQQQLNEAQTIFSKIPFDVPKPSADMEIRFSALLGSYKEQNTKPFFLNSTIERLRDMRSFHPGIRLAFGVVLVLAGIGIGYIFFHDAADSRSQMQLDILSNKVDDMRQTMILALLNNPSPGERLRAVSYVEESAVNKLVIDALFTTLNEDPNVNVRLVTLDALMVYSNNPLVRQKLVQSIGLQESPLMQAALADVMLGLREKKALVPLRSLLEREELSNPIREKIQTTIQTLQL